MKPEQLELSPSGWMFVKEMPDLKCCRVHDAQSNDFYSFSSLTLESLFVILCGRTACKEH